MRMSRIPAADITSASPTFAQVMPIAPAASCICAISGVLCAFACGRQPTPCARHAATMRAMLASIRSRSTSSAGVSSADFGFPTRLADGEARVSMADILRLQAGGTIGVVDQAECLEIVGRPGFERCAGLEAIDEVRDHAVEARLIAAIAVVSLDAR